jgi:hypothetical protein
VTARAFDLGLVEMTQIVDRPQNGVNGLNFMGRGVPACKDSVVPIVPKSQQEEGAEVAP